MAYGHLGNPELANYVERAHAHRTEAMARFGYVTVVGASRIAAGAGALLRRGWNGWQQWQERRAAIRSLSALDDRLLRDIGLTRDDIRWAIDGPATTSADTAVPAPKPAAIVTLPPRPQPRGDDLPRAA